MENCAFGIEFVTVRKEGYIFGFFVYYVIEYSDGRHDVLCGRSKHSVGRQNACNNRGSTLSPVRVLDPAEESTLSPVMMRYPAEARPILAENGHSLNEASTLTRVRVFSPIRGSTLSRITMLYAGEANTLSRVRVLYPNAETLCRPSEYFRKSRKHRVGRQSALCDKCKLDVIIK
jgi:hypothetical protein